MLAVTPLGSGLSASVTLPLKLVRCKETVSGEVPVPWTRVIVESLRLATAIETWSTVSVKVAVAGLIPEALAVMVTTWPLITAALVEACKTIEPEFPGPGFVMVAATPFGKGLSASVTLPVELVRAMLTVMAGDVLP